MVIFNLYAFRTKDPKVMSTAADPVGPMSDSVLVGISGTVIAGWGTNADPTRDARVMALLPRLHSLGVTKDAPGIRSTCVQFAAIVC